jgi:hypothetical protein
MNIFRKTPLGFGALHFSSFLHPDILKTFGFVNPYPNPILYPYLRLQSMEFKHGEPLGDVCIRISVAHAGTRGGVFEIGRYIGGL